LLKVGSPIVCEVGPMPYPAVNMLFRRRYDDVGDAVRAAYGPNYESARRRETSLRPENIFNLNHNIDPGEHEIR
jgi:hypothetical protein